MARKAARLWLGLQMSWKKAPLPLSSNRKFSFSLVLNLFLFKNFFSSMLTCYSCYNYRISLSIYIWFLCFFLLWSIYNYHFLSLFSSIDVSFFCTFILIFMFCFFLSYVIYIIFIFSLFFRLLMFLSFVLSFSFSCSDFSLSPFGSNSPRSTLTKVKTRETETDKLSTQKTLKLNQNSFYTDLNFAF